MTRLAPLLLLLIASTAFGQFDRAAVNRRLGVSEPLNMLSSRSGDISIDGPHTANVGESVKLTIRGLDLDPSKTVLELFDEVARVPIVYSSRNGGSLVASSSLVLDPLNRELRCEVTVVASDADVYVVVLRDGDGELFHWLTVGGEPPKPPDPPQPPPPPPIQKPTAVTYFYEKDQTAVPPPVAAAISELNTQGIAANIVEQTPADGTGAVPLQYKFSWPAAKDAGLPCLVVMAGETVVRVVKGPKTQQEVLEAVKP